MNSKNLVLEYIIYPLLKMEKEDILMDKRWPFCTCISSLYCLPLLRSQEGSTQVTHNHDSDTYLTYHLGNVAVIINAAHSEIEIIYSV